ncbi:MAG: hypothetical protein ACRDOO_04160, partial [Actinomadura sp.]
MTTTTRPPRAARTGPPGTRSAAKPTTEPTTGSGGRGTAPATRPKPAAAPGRTVRRTTAEGPVRVAPAAPPRAPFVLLVLGLLGGALVSLLLLNTVLAEDAFTRTKLQRSNKQLNEQRQALQ